MKIRSLVLGLMTTCAASALAAAALADPPARVGRISYVDGAVSLQPPQEDFWTEASRNYPVAQGEAFWTGDSGRAELQIGAMEAWLDNQTQLDVVDLDYGQTRLSLAQGSLELRVWRVPRGGISISTPAGDVRIDYAGLYRIDVGAPQSDGSYPEVAVTTFEGESGAPGPDGLMAVNAGEAMVIDPGYAPQPVELQYAALDDWAHDREARENWSWRDDVSPALTGSEELGRYGDYQYTPDYGQVWFPREVPADWAPYRYGHWAYVQPWGWTWIDDQPWGFAPFHYGRWAQVGGRWGWVAGSVAAEPVYAPAMVAFVGGHGWSVGIGIGGGGGGEAMGWVPLAPGEVYRPSYQVSDTYIRQVNVTNVSRTTINNITVNNTTVNNVTVNNYRNAPAAVVVRQDAFARGAPVQKAVVPVSAQMLASAPVAAAASRPLPAPTPEARAAAIVRPGVGKASAAGGPAAMPQVVHAAPPPARLQAVRAAVVAQPSSGGAHPPPIAGAAIAAPRPAGAPRPAMVAPAQLANPAAQARRGPPPPSTVTPPPGYAARPAAAPQAAATPNVPPRRMPQIPPSALPPTSGPAARPAPTPSVPAPVRSAPQPQIPAPAFAQPRPPAASPSPTYAPARPPAAQSIPPSAAPRTPAPSPGYGPPPPRPAPPAASPSPTYGPARPPAAQPAPPSAAPRTPAPSPGYGPPPPRPAPPAATQARPVAPPPAAAQAGPAVPPPAQAKPAEKPKPQKDDEKKRPEPPQR